MADLKKYDTVAKSEAGIWIPILDEGEATGIEINILGPDSKAFKQAANGIRKYVTKQKEKGTAPSNDEMDERSIQMISACTIGWRDVSEEGVELKADKDGLIIEGEVWKFNTENAMTVFKGYPFLADQVAGAIMDRSRFLDR